jgi:hypothetical protein
MFNGRDLVEPGLVLVPHWRPEAEPGPDADQAWTCGASPVPAALRPQTAAALLAVIHATAMITKDFGSYKRRILRQDKSLRDHGDGMHHKSSPDVTQAVQNSASTKRASPAGEHRASIPPTPPPARASQGAIILRRFGVRPSRKVMIVGRWGLYATEMTHNHP